VVPVVMVDNQLTVTVVTVEPAETRPVTAQT
jgi:hypothetical protein